MGADSLNFAIWISSSGFVFFGSLPPRFERSLKA
jgi:hypothetical protein